MKKLAKRFIPWKNKQLGLKKIINGFAQNDKRKNPKIKLQSIVNEVFNIGFSGEGSINEHYQNPNSIAENICSQGHFYQLLDLLSLEEGRNNWLNILKQKKREHYFDEFYVENKKLLLSIDGWESPRSKVKCCDDCLTVTHGNGTVEYFHRYVFACITHPVKQISVILDVEPNCSTDGNKKQDCELKQTKRILERINKKAHGLWHIVILDALYNASNILNKIKSEYSKDYIVVVKNKRLSIYKEAQKALTKSYQEISETEKEIIVTNRSIDPIITIEKLNHATFSIEAVIKNKNNNTFDFWLWMTSLKINSPLKITAIARRRWQEEEFFNLAEYQHHINHIQTHKKNAMKTIPFILMICSSVIQLFLLRHNKKSFTKNLKQKSPLKNYKYFLKYCLLIINGFVKLDSS